MCSFICELSLVHALLFARSYVYVCTLICMLIRMSFRMYAPTGVLVMCVLLFVLTQTCALICGL